MSQNDTKRPSRRAFLRRFYLIGPTLLFSGPVIAAATSLPPSAWRMTMDDGSTSRLKGRAIDLATDQPVSGASIRVSPSGQSTTTNASGTYVLNLPTGTFSVHVAAPGYIGTSRLNQTVGAEPVVLDLELIPSAPTPDQQLLLYQRLVKESVSPLVTADELQRARTRSMTDALPTTITVYYDRANPPYKQIYPLEDYVKGVVPNEMPASWPPSALQAQAVAARTYGVASQIANGFVYPDTRSQVFNPNNRYDTTDAAVDATGGQVMTYGGSVVHAFFFSRCNGIATHNSENAAILDPNNPFHCIPAGWNYVAYCRARPCPVHAGYTGDDCGYYGHGVGMCQWGAYGRAINGESYQSILGDYYTGISYVTIPDGAPTPTPTPTPSPRPLGPGFALPGDVITLRWTSGGPGASYSLVLLLHGNALARNTTSSLSWLIGKLPLGTYTWTIQANNGSMMATATLRVVTHIYQDALPFVGN